MSHWRLLVGGFAGIAVLVFPALSLAASVGSASLEVVGATSTPTHWNIPFDSPTTAFLRGVSTDEVGDPLPATITVWVKSSNFGNTIVEASRVDVTSDYEFTYTPPVGACNTTIVAYQESGLNSNNDLADDGILNGSGTAACGFRFLDANGNPIDCTISVEGDTWGRVKGLYR